MPAKPKIGIVGPCASGKTTLIKGLTEYGYQAKHIAQEHSYVPGMWQLVSNPDQLIYLDVSYEESLRRRPMNWTQQEYNQEIDRLQHARANAHFYLHTDGISINEVRQRVLDFLKASA